MRFSVEQEESLFTAPEKYKLWPQATLHSQWPDGPGVSGNRAFDQFYASQVESIASTVKTEELMFPADVALLEKIGPAIVLTHSQSGVFGFKLADARPDLVKAHIAVEPNGPPFYDIDFKGGDDWYKDSDKIARFWGVARLPLAYDPPAAEASELHLARQKEPDEPVLVRCWLQSGARTAAIKNEECADRDRDRRGILPRDLRSLHVEVPDSSRRAKHSSSVGESRSTRQWTHDDA
jgi:pimeloyl-ACP methyl ester carboxylesterase